MRVLSTMEVQGPGRPSSAPRVQLMLLLLSILMTVLSPGAARAIIRSQDSRLHYEITNLEQSSISFSCTYTGSDQQQSYFFKDGELLQTSDRITLSPSGSTLQIMQPLSIDDQGVYKCGSHQFIPSNRSEGLVIFVVSPKKSPTPPEPEPIVAKHRESVTLDCPLQFIKDMGTAQQYLVVWKAMNLTSENVLVDNSIVKQTASDLVTYNSTTLQLTVLNVTETKYYQCIINGNGLLPPGTGGLFINSDRSCLVKVIQLERKDVSIKFFPSVAEESGTVNIQCTQEQPSYNKRFMLNISSNISVTHAQDSSIWYNGSVPSKTSFNVTCTVMQTAKSLAVVTDYATERLIVIDRPRWSKNAVPENVDSRGCTQRVGVELESQPVDMSLLYRVTEKQDDTCPHSDSRNAMINQYQHTSIVVDLNQLPYDGSRVPLYVRSWRRYMDTDGPCSVSIELKRAAFTCFAPPGEIAGIVISTVAVVLSLVIIVIVCYWGWKKYWKNDCLVPDTTSNQGGNSNDKEKSTMV